MTDRVSANLVYRYDGGIESAHPSWVLRDDGRTVALWQPGGTVSMHTLRERGGPRRRNLLPGQPDAGYRERIWRGDGVVKVHQTGDPFSVWRWFTRRGWRPGYYVNLEEPWQPGGGGWVTEDWILDVVAADDLSWSLKDEDEFEWALQTGRFDSALADRIREAAGEAAARIEAAKWPFGADWDEWLPLPRTLPQLAEGWDA